MIRTLCADLVDLVLPRLCVGCGLPGAALCPECGEPGAPPRLREAEFGPVAAAHAYRDGMRSALIGYKERNRRDLTRALGAQLAEAITAVLLVTGTRCDDVLLVPVASDRRVARARGGDHVLRLARVAARLSGARVWPALYLSRTVRDSAGLGTVERALNLADSMRASPAPADQCALVVDDIVTSGATLSEAARALAAAGWPVIGAAVVAETPKRSA